MHQRPDVAAGRPLLTLSKDAAGSGPLRRWRGSDLKPEAALFLLLLLTFAAVLWGDSVRETRLTLTDSSLRFLPYTYSDANEGGATSITSASDKPLSWSCTLRPEVKYPYCGYGLQYQETKAAAGSIDLSRYDRVALKVAYRGEPSRLKLTFKNFDPRYSRPGQGDSTMPVVAEFAVKPGINTIALDLTAFAVDQWWLDNHSRARGKIAPDFRHIVAIDLVSGGGMTSGTFSVEVNDITFTGIRLSAKQWYLLILAVWLVVAGGYLVYRFLSVRRSYEVRQRKQMRESKELAGARAAAEAASNAKSQFLANMSHELRTPLNAILGYSQLLEREDLSERQRSAVDTIHQSGSHLLTLITDILDLSKIEAGKLDLLLGSFDLFQCVSQVSDMVRLRSEEKGLHFELQLSPDLPAQVIGDAKRIRQILLNLLGNAVKFTATGSIRLEISVATWGEGCVRLRMDVIDTGAGIAQPELERLFRPFEQAGSPSDRSGGTGLGLSISRQLVHAMHGDIEVQSTLGTGTRFRVEIPCDLANSMCSRSLEALPAPQATGIEAGAPALNDLPVSNGGEPKPPSADWLERFLTMARAGNMRGIRQLSTSLAALEPEYEPFAARLLSLAAAYRSPCVLRLIEENLNRRDAA